jgi:hypothetical protein
MQKSNDLVVTGGESREVAVRRATGMPPTASGRAAFGSAPGVPAVAAAELALAAAALAENAKAPNTRRAYESDWASWEAFCQAHNFVPLPADPEQVMLYLTHLTDFFGSKGKKLRPRTAERHLAAIATTHCALGLTFDRNVPRSRKRSMASGGSSA